MHHHCWLYSCSGSTDYSTSTTTLTDYVYDANNRMTKKTDSINGDIATMSRYYYDRAGNTLSEQNKVYSTAGTQSSNMGISGRSTGSGTKVYTYDEFNRVVQYNDGATEAKYAYNANNLRTSKTVNGTKTNFVWNGQNLAGETKNNQTTVYTYDPTGVIGSKTNSTYTRYIKDPHGNVIATSQNDNITGEYDYTAFGTERLNTAGTMNPFRYCGEYYDEESGNIYLRNRYYSPNTGRFINEDPIKYRLNWYSYCYNNPIAFVDPWGLCEKCFENYEDYVDLCDKEYIDDIFGNMSKSEYLHVKETPTANYICAYVKIKTPAGVADIRNQKIEGTNITYRQDIIQGIIESWSGRYDDGGVSKRVKVVIRDLSDVHSNQTALPIYLRPESEAHAPDGTLANAWTWPDGNSKYIVICAGAYDVQGIKNVAGHEFGHILGLDDVYYLNRPFESIMCHQDQVNGAQQVDYAMLFKYRTWAIKGQPLPYAEDVLTAENKVVYY